MKEKLVFLLFLLFGANLVIGQIQFEISDGNLTNGWAASVEVEAGYLFVGYDQKMVLLSQDGVVIDSLSHSNLDSIQFQYVYETPDSYIVIGMTEEVDTMVRFWKGLFSKDLEFQSEQFIPISLNKVGQILEFHWDGVSDTVLFVGWARNPTMAGSIDLATEEVVKNKQLVPFPTRQILRRRTKPGYMATGYTITYLDENFELDTFFRFHQNILGSGVAGLDVEYVTDSTFIFATHFKCSVSKEYVQKGDLGVMVGIMDEDFQILNVDTIIMPKSESWTLLPYREQTLAASTDSTFIVAGKTYPYEGKATRIFCAKYSKAGERLFANTYFTPQKYNHLAIKVTATSDGGCLIFGYREPGGDAYILKIGPNGILTGEVTIPLAQSIQVYPNPTTDEIRFDLDNLSRELNLELIDLQGKVVLQRKILGSYEISTKHLSKGVYVYRLQYLNGNLFRSGKIIKK